MYHFDAGGTSYNRYNTLRMKQTSIDDFLSGSGAQDQWSTGIETAGKTDGIKTSIDNNNTIELRVDRGLLLSYFTGVFAADCEIKALYLERVPDTANAEYVEPTGCFQSSGGAYEWTPFSENEAASSFIFKEVAVHNTLITNAKTSEGRTYPVFRSGF